MVTNGICQHTEGQTELLIVFQPEPETGPEEFERLARQLQRVVGEQDIESVARPPGLPGPEGSKGDLAGWGSLLVTLGGAGGVLASLVGVIREWLDRHAGAHRVQALPLV